MLAPFRCLQERKGARPANNCGLHDRVGMVIQGAYCLESYRVIGGPQTNFYKLYEQALGFYLNSNEVALKRPVVL